MELGKISGVDWEKNHIYIILYNLVVLYNSTHYQEELLKKMKLCTTFHYFVFISFIERKLNHLLICWYHIGS